MKPHRASATSCTPETEHETQLRPTDNLRLWVSRSIDAVQLRTHGANHFFLFPCSFVLIWLLLSWLSNLTWHFGNGFWGGNDVVEKRY